MFIPGPSGINASGRVRGLVQDNILAMLSNADGRAILNASLPDEEVQKIVDRAYSNDDVENLFSSYVQSVGFKATVHEIGGVARKLDTLYLTRNDPTKEFFINVSKNKRYDAADASIHVVASWNNGSALDPSSDQYVAFVNESKKGDQRNIRDYFKNK